MRVGRLKHRVPVYRYVYDQDEFGAQVRNCVKVGTFACGIVHDMNSKDDSDGFEQNQHTITLETRYNRAFGVVNNDMFLEFGGHEWDIESVLNVRFENKRLIIECKLKGDTHGVDAHSPAI